MERAVDEFGFFLDSKDANPVLNAKNKSRESDWILFLQTGNWNPTQLKKMCRLGIPDSLRAQVWLKLANAESKKKEGLYRDYLQKSALELDQNTKDVINRDLSRTFPNHIMFSDAKGSGISHLKSVLYSYAIYNPSVGYCQGMGMVVGIMLMRMPPEDAFYLLVAIVDRYMTDYYTPDLSQLRQDGLVFNHLLHKHSKKVAKRLDQLGIDPLIYLTQWFMPIYAISLPWRAVLRVWDMFFCDGVKTLHRIALGIIYLSQDYIIQSGTSTSEVLNFLLHIPRNMISPDELIEASLKFRITKVDIEQIRGKMRNLDKEPVSQSNSKLLIKSKFNFDADFKGHFFLKSNSLAKSRDFQRTGGYKSDFSITTGKASEVIETNIAKIQDQPKAVSHSELGLNSKKAIEGEESLIAKSMDINLATREVENDVSLPCEAKSYEDYLSSSKGSNESRIVQNSGT